MIACRRVLFAGLIASQSCFARAEDVEYGKYICITDHEVGIQPSTVNPNETYAGAIRSSTEIEKVFVDIVKIDDSTDDFDKDKQHLHYLRFCQNVYPLDVIEKHRHTDGDFPYLDAFISACLAVSSMTIKAGTRERTHYSTG